MKPREASDSADAGPVGIVPGVVRLTAGNPGPFTFRGTNSYIIGRTDLAIVDPGPDDARHRAALSEAVAGRPVAAILLTHRHRDHAGGAAALAAILAAPVLAGEAGPDHPARRPPAGLAPLPEPDRLLADGEAVAGEGWRLEAVATPGHASDHLCFALAGTGILFSGDHVMGWSTSSVVPPDGSMAACVASLEKLAARHERVYLPGHGEPVAGGLRRLAVLRRHRRRREREILARLHAGDTGIEAIAAAIYQGLDPRLLPLARAAVLAHLIDLAARGLARGVAEPGPDTDFFPV